MNTTTDTARLCSASEARALVRALDVLDAIESRATKAAYDNRSSASSFGRVAGTCAAANRVLFSAFSTTGIYGGSEQATAAMQRYLKRGEGDE